MTVNIKRHWETLSTVKDQLTHQLHSLIILGVETTSQTDLLKLRMNFPGKLITSEMSKIRSANIFQIVIGFWTF